MPVPRAGRARPAGHHLAEERPLHALHLAAAAAGVAAGRVGARTRCRRRSRSRRPPRCRRSGPGSAPNAVSASSRSSRISASAPCRTRLRGPRAVDAPKKASMMSPSPPKPAAERAARPRSAARRERVAAEVDDLPLLRVGEHLVRRRDLLEPLLRRRVRVDVRVQVPRELAVGPLDLLARRVPAHPEHAVVVRRHDTPASWHSIVQTASLRAGRGARRIPVARVTLSGQAGGRDRDADAAAGGAAVAGLLGGDVEPADGRLARPARPR